jgi:hypothetical protein
MRKPLSITKACIRYYSDNQALTASVEWSDGSHTEGGVVTKLPRPLKRFQIERLRPCDFGSHMQALLLRAEREGTKIETQIW